MNGMQSILVMLLMISLGGCATVTVGQLDADVQRPPDVEQRLSFHLWGTVPQTYTLLLSDLCPGELQKAQTLYTFDDIFISLFRIGIYQPRTLRVWCEDPV